MENLGEKSGIISTIPPLTAPGDVGKASDDNKLFGKTRGLPIPMRELVIESLSNAAALSIVHRRTLILDRGGRRANSALGYRATLHGDSVDHFFNSAFAH
jgi:hypothetical protein